jgi:hypothetical protein
MSSNREMVVDGSKVIVDNRMVNFQTMTHSLFKPKDVDGVAVLDIYFPGDAFVIFVGEEAEKLWEIMQRKFYDMSADYD